MHNIRHNGTMYATANMVRARACGKLVLGDKANPQTTFHLNEGHVTDMCEIGGDLQSQRDVHYEVKVPSALTKTRQAGQGSAAHGGCCAGVRHWATTLGKSADFQPTKSSRPRNTLRARSKASQGRSMT